MLSKNLRKFSLIILALVLTTAVSACVKKLQPSVNSNTNQSTNINQAEEIDQATQARLKEELALLFTDPFITSFTISRYMDEFTTGNAGVRDSSGFWWIAKKIDGTWKIIFQGQENVSCSILKKNEVPLKFHPYNCFNDSGSDEVLYSDYLKGN